MKGKRYIAYLLMWVCVLMLTITALPHHHHNGVFCFHEDLIHCLDADHECDHSHHTADSTPCEDHCIAKFETNARVEILQVPPFTELYVAVLETADLYQSLPFGEEYSLLNDSYIESLHGLLIGHAVSLRAPPACIL